MIINSYIMFSVKMKYIFKKPYLVKTNLIKDT